MDTDDIPFALYVQLRLGRTRCGFTPVRMYIYIYTFLHRTVLAESIFYSNSSFQLFCLVPFSGAGGVERERRGCTAPKPGALAPGRHAAGLTRAEERVRGAAAELGAEGGNEKSPQQDLDASM